MLAGRSSSRPEMLMMVVKMSLAEQGFDADGEEKRAENRALWDAFGETMSLWWSSVLTFTRRLELKSASL